MRLTQDEIEIIKNAINNIFGETKIYLFGSRLDESKKGGDIDIFIIPQKSLENERVKKSKVTFLLEENLLKPIDIVIHKDFKRAIEQEALKGVEL